MPVLGGGAGGPGVGMGVPPPSALSPSALFKPLTLYDPGLMGPGYHLPPHVHPLAAAYPAALMNQLYALPYARPDHYALLERHSALAKGRGLLLSLSALLDSFGA